MEIAFDLAAFALPLAGLFYWGRGIVKSNKGDIILGFTVMAIYLILVFVGSNTSAVFGDMGIILIVFGLETLIVNAFAKPECPLTKQHRITLGVASLIVGVMAGMIV